MEEKPKINLKQHTSPPASKKYLFRIVFYIILLSVLSFIIASQLGKKETPKNPEVIEIQTFTIED